MRVLQELRRRNVHRMAALYLAGAWLVSQVAGVLVDLQAVPSSIGKPLLALMVLGFPIVLALSWFYELTPDGIVLEKDVEREHSITHLTGRRLDFVVIAVLLAAVLLFAWHTWVRPIASVPPAHAENTVAVLAFDNMSGDLDQEYFSDGVAEQLLDTLAKEPWLVVKSRTSSFAYKGRNVDIPTIAKELRVSHVIEGSVRRDGDRLRVTAQLIDAVNDTHLWSDSIDRDSASVFAIQDEVAAAVVKALRTQLGIEDDRPVSVVGTRNKEAHDAYLRGRYLLAQRTNRSIEAAIQAFQRAVDSDPNFAAAHAELAMAWRLFVNVGGIRSDDAIARATPHAQLALALDENSPEAHAALGLLAMRTLDVDLMMRHFHRAIELKPSYSIVYAWMALVYGGTGQYKDEFAALGKASELDPLSMVATTNYSYALMKRKRFDEARRLIESLAMIAPAQHAQFMGNLADTGSNWSSSALGTLDAMLIDQDDTSWAWEFANGLTSLGLDDEVVGLTSILGDDALGFLQMHIGLYSEMLANSRWNSNPPKGARNRGAFGLVLANVGDFERAKPYLEELWVSSCERTVTESWCYVPQITSLVFVRRAAGQDASDIIAGIRDNVRRLEEAGVVLNYRDESPDFSAGIADYLDGKREAGLARMQKAVEEGYFVPVGEHYLQPMFDDPGFTPILAIQKEHQARESAIFLEVVCNDNPYAEVWQPLDSTCETFQQGDRD